MYEVFIFVAGLLAGAGLVWFVRRQLVAETEAKFRALSSEALSSNTEHFLHLAQERLDARTKAVEELVRPLGESLEKLERARTGAYSALSEQVRSLAESQSHLVKALRAPAARGRWGEIQLRRVVEMAGMLEYCDFCEQQTLHTADGRLRPDLVVRLPNNRRIVVDSKVPLAAYMDAYETSDDTLRAGKLRDHARQLRAHLSSLSARAYWAQFDSAPDFVVAFLPGESFYSTALQHDPELLEYGIEQRVLVATPTTLIALLKAVAYGWRQESVTQNAQEISRLGRELHDRIGTLVEHFSKVGASLDRATQAYNQTVGALESRVLVSARKLKETGISTNAEIAVPEPVERVTRTVM